MSLKIVETKNLEKALKALEAFDYAAATILLNRALDEDQSPDLVWVTRDETETKVNVTFSKVADAENFFKSTLKQLNGR